MRRRVLDHAFLDQHLQRHARHRAGQRVAAEGAAVVAGLEDAQHLLVREHRRDGVEAARQRLADHGQVGLDAVVLLGQQLAGAAQAGLDLVGDEGDAVVGADAAHLARDSRRAAR